MTFLTREVCFSGGFSNSEHQLKSVACRIVELGLADNAFYRTFPQAANPESDIDTVTRGISLMTFSSGVLAATSARPLEIVAFAPLLPKSPIRYGIDTLVKTRRNYEWAKKHEQLPGLAGFNHELLKSLLTKGAMGHWSPFLRGVIPRFDSIDVISRRLAGGFVERAEMVFGEDDAYFTPTDRQIARIDRAGIKCSVLKGVLHDSLVIDPAGTLKKYIDFHSGN